MKQHENENSSFSNGPAVTDAPIGALLSEVARRLRLRFGRLEVVFHDGNPSPKIMVEHRVLKDLDE